MCMLPFLALFALAVLWILVNQGKISLNATRPSSAPTSRAPLELLRERYARGEISREEYETMRRDLEE